MKWNIFLFLVAVFVFAGCKALMVAGTVFVGISEAEHESKNAYDKYVQKHGVATSSYT